MSRTKADIKIIIAAIDCAAGPPLKANPFASRAGVPWPDIDRLRAALDAAGIDWRAVKIENDKILAAKRAWHVSPEGRAAQNERSREYAETLKAKK